MNSFKSQLMGTGLKLVVCKRSEVRRGYGRSQMNIAANHPMFFRSKCPSWEDHKCKTPTTEAKQKQPSRSPASL